MPEKGALITSTLQLGFHLRYQGNNILLDGSVIERSCLALDIE